MKPTDEAAARAWLTENAGGLLVISPTKLARLLAATRRDAEREMGEACARRARQSACVCAVLRGNHPERITRGGEFGIEHNRHLSDCPQAIAADLRAMLEEK